MAHMTEDIRSYTDASAFLGDREDKKLGHNTWVERMSDCAIGIRYHRTIIVVYRADGAIRLSPQGWTTTTTIQRLNACTPYNVWSEGNGTHAVTGHGDSARLCDTMWSDTDGRWQGHKQAQFETAMSHNGIARRLATIRRGW